MTSVGKSGEFARIAQLREIYATSLPQLLTGIGDDCAVLAGGGEPRVWTIDAALEGVHFDRAFMGLRDIGYRAFMAAASDVAAMGAKPDGALSALVLPTSLTDDELFALAHGTAEAARACACPVVGGNLARGQALSITTTVMGSAARPITRSGARPGDGVYVTGPVGAAGLGLRALAARAQDRRFHACIARFLRPHARFDRAELIAACATAAIDLSDGLAQDLGHVAEASGVGITLALADLPRVADFEDACRALGADPVALMLAGGEDYELAFTAPPGAVPRDLAHRIGEVYAGPPRLTVRDADGNERPVDRGFDHFG